MPLQNRVTPEGLLIATEARGTLMGNRGGAIHNDQRQIVRPFKSRQWITCVLQFKDRRRVVMTPRLYTELFFLDEATAFAAGHRPCAECRRADFLRFLGVWPGRVAGEKLYVDAIDRVLHGERVGDRGAKVTYREALEHLPDGTFVRREGGLFLVKGASLLEWSPAGYVRCFERTAGEVVEVLTPRSMVACFEAGYVPAVHPSAALLG
ncbi:hypothetical protein [Paludibaculum fermentans]|uniref:hypothetical protein n=1 Tax=Paludibaculum fermentans TaxID=1473598 RepID=UPI003EB9D92C